MKKKIKNINGLNLVWLFIYLMPFLIVGGWVLINWHSELSSIYSLSDFINSIKLNLVFDIPIFEALRDSINYLGFNNTFSDFLLIVFSYVTYLIIVCFIRILFDILVMLPNIIHNFIDKVGGERE